MAKLYFYYSAMNAGKSTTLLQSSHNYKERGMECLLFTPNLDDRFVVGKIHSRIGLEASAIAFGKSDNLFNIVANTKAERQKLACVLIDEAQFLTKDQVYELSDICDQLSIPVLAYGIRTDFRGELFEGAKYLLALAENIIEIKTVCHCGRKATMNLRLDKSGKVVKDGAQVKIGGNESYQSACRKHFKQARAEEVDKGIVAVKKKSLSDHIVDNANKKNPL